MRITVWKGCHSLAHAALVVLIATAATSALACPTCKDAMAADPDAANLARGYYYSILFMLSMPPTILAGLGLMIYLEIRKARRLKSLSLST